MLTDQPAVISVPPRFRDGYDDVQYPMEVQKFIRPISVVAKVEVRRNAKRLPKIAMRATGGIVNGLMCVDTGMPGRKIRRKSRLRQSPPQRSVAHARTEYVVIERRFRTSNTVHWCTSSCRTCDRKTRCLRDNDFIHQTPVASHTAHALPQSSAQPAHRKHATVEQMQSSLTGRDTEVQHQFHSACKLHRQVAAHTPSVHLLDDCHRDARRATCACRLSKTPATTGSTSAGRNGISTVTFLCPDIKC
jgi:hypothetical protein